MGGSGGGIVVGAEVLKVVGVGKFWWGSCWRWLGARSNERSCEDG